MLEDQEASMLFDETVRWARVRGLALEEAEDFTQQLLLAACKPGIEQPVRYFRSIRGPRFYGFMADKRRRESRNDLARGSDFDAELEIDQVADERTAIELDRVATRLSQPSWVDHARPDDLEFMRTFDRCDGDGIRFASELGISRQAARQRLSRCRRRLHEVIDRHRNQ